MKQHTLALAIAAILAHPALAADDEGQAVLPEVRVRAPAEGGTDFRSDTATTATRTETPLADIPQAITIVPESLIEAQRAFTLRDALRNVPGLTIAAGEGGRTGDSITLRGFAANSDTYLDGVKDNGQYFRDTFFIERIEVLKGPSSVLFGRGATGGVVNLISKKPQRETAAAADLTVGSFDLKRISVDGNAAGERFAGRVAALWHDADSFRDFNFTERNGIAPAVSARLGEDSSLTLQGLYQREDSVYDYGVPMFRGRPADVDIETFYGFPEDRFQEFKTDITTLTWEQAFTDDFRLRNTLRYADYQRDYRTHLFGTVTDTGATSTVARSQALRASGQQNLINQADFIYDGKIAGHDNTLLFGFEIADEEFDFLSKNSTGVPVIAIFDPVLTSSVGAGRANDLAGVLNSARDVQADTRAVYVQDQYTLTPQWKLLGGLRYDKFEASARDGLTGTKLDNDNDFISPRAGVVYQPDEMQSYYASYAESFNPSAESFFLSAATTELDPEENQNYELGAKYTWLDGRLGLGAAVFRLEKDKARTTDPIDPSLQTLTGEQRTDGFEIELAGALGQNVQAFLAYAYLDAEIVNSNNLQSGIPIEGKRPSNVAQHNGVLWADWEFIPNWSLGGGVFFVSSRPTDNANTAELPGYGRVDAVLGYHQKRWDLQLNLYNLGDKEYFESGQLRSALPGIPFATSLSLKVHL